MKDLNQRIFLASITSKQMSSLFCSRNKKEDSNLQVGVNGSSCKDIYHFFKSISISLGSVSSIMVINGNNGHDQTEFKS